MRGYHTYQFVWLFNSTDSGIDIFLLYIILKCMCSVHIAGLIMLHCQSDILSTALSVILSYLIWALDGNGVSTSTFEYFITEFTISVCTFLFEGNLFWLLSTISLPMLRRLCACAFVVQPILARHLVMCASVYVRVSVSTAVTHQSSKQITVLFNYWTLLAVWIYKHTSGHTLIQA